MAYVVTQSCCVDASCVVACPVNCIHPAPGEPGFGDTAMVFIDERACVGCGACVTACPAGAIVPDSKLRPDQERYIGLAAEYYDCFGHDDRPPLAIVPEQRRLARTGPFRVAVVGAGPAGMYVADELLKHPEVSVHVYDRLPTPYGLVRGGVAPDHTSTRGVEQLFEAIAQQPGFDYRLNVEIGRDLSHDELAEHYDAVVYSVGASRDRRLDIEGEDLRGSLAATDVVGWYNAHPDQVDLDVPVDTERAVIVGNGNVALDVARILTAELADLAGTDIADHALAQLRRSQVREVVLLGRRGVAEAAFTEPELIGLAALAGRTVNVRVEAPEIGDAPHATLLRQLAETPVDDALPTIVLRFQATPVAILGDRAGRTVALIVEKTMLMEVDGRTAAVATGAREVIETGLVIRAVGHVSTGLPIGAGDEGEHEQGRLRPGVYVAGWVKRGPRGFIGTNKSCAEETVARVLDDLESGATKEPAPLEQLDRLLVKRCAVVDAEAWGRIDAEERRRGRAQGRPRRRLASWDELLHVAQVHRERAHIG